MKPTRTDGMELSVQDIGTGITFSIPNYQRGYRWTKREVRALLDDLLAFGKDGDADEPYCLQPLVLQKKDGKIWVVDGQQRLTTMAIVLRVLGMSGGWNIEYTSERDEEGRAKRLSDLLEHPGASINDHFRKEAKKTAEEWLSEEPSRG